MDVVVANQVLFGTRKGKNCNERFTEITEDRGTSLILPFANFSVDDKRNRIHIKTHNYVGYNTVNQAIYVDCRFVGFTDGNGKVLS
jgi:CRISPR-associated protein (TIGR03984 family)